MQQYLDLGQATLSRRRAVAGSYATLTYTYKTGHPIDDSGCLKIALRFAGDFGRPQFDRPREANYCSLATDGDCTIVPRWDEKGHTRPFGRALYLKITRGFLDRGRQVTLTFGDTSMGSPGWLVQTFCEDTFEFQTHVDPIATYEFKPLPQSPTMKIVPGQPARAVCLAPSQTVAGERFDYFLKIEDAWGNPVCKPQRLRTRLEKPGIHTVTARDKATGLEAASNPVRVLTERPETGRFWADFHGQSEETIGTNTIEDYLTFARDQARLDIAGHQGNDFQITDAFWDTINRVSGKYCLPGSFVTFPGYEWSGNTPLGGDRNIYFENEGGSIVHSCTDLLPNKKTRYTIAATAAELYERLAERSSPRAFAFAHVGGRYADLSMHHPQVELAVEVHSAWGTFDWLVDDALRLGYRIAICANSDGHKGRPGASYPGAKQFGSLGGLTCVLANKLDRPSVVAALRARHCYATTGHRPIIDVSLSTPAGDTAVMGDVMAADTATLHVRLAGTAPVERVDVKNGLQTVKTLRPYTARNLGRRIKIAWGGSEVRGRDRLVDWKGTLRVRGNRICQLQPINFWRPDCQPQRLSANRWAWSSMTTGNTAGLILTLERPHAGALELRTAQKTVRRAVRDIAFKPRLTRCGGIDKQIEMLRLPPSGEAHREFDFNLPLRGLHSGDNPVYVRVTQEDGHVTWSSPIYITRA